MYSSEYLAQCSEHAAQLLSQKLKNDPSSFKAYHWDSDFSHDPNWSVVPLYLNYEWCNREMHTFRHPLASLGKGLFVEALNNSAKDKFPLALACLNEFISSNDINYIGVSLLPPHTVLHPHKHVNPGNLKLHASVQVSHSCGLTYSDGLNTYQHYWSSSPSSVYFDDNFTHSAWNNSSENRYVLILDFRKNLLTY